MTDFATLSTEELVARFNKTFNKNVKKGSYTRKRMIADLEVEAPAEKGACPFCKGDPANQTPAGEEGTFLGDNVNYCNECDTHYSIHTHEVVDIDEAPKKKRRVLNPQPKIDAKTAACDEVNIEVFYSKVDRLWAFAHKGKIVHTMTSRQFSEYTAEELAAYAQTFI